MSEQTNPFSSMRLEFQPSRFYGRRNVVNAILVGIGGDHPRSFLVEGFKLLGKTSLWRFLTHDQGACVERPELWSRIGTSPRKPPTFVYLDCALRPAEQHWMVWFCREVLQVARERMTDGPLPMSDCDPNTVQDATEALRQLLLESTRQGARLVIGIDHFDPIVRSMTREEERALALVRPHAAFVVFLEESPEKLNPKLPSPSESPFWREMEMYNLPLLSPAEAERLVLDPVSQPGAMPGESVFAKRDADYLVDLVGRHPYLLTVACEWLYEMYQSEPETRVSDPHWPAEARAEDLLGLASIQGVFGAFWRRLSTEERRVLLEITEEDQSVFERDRPVIAGLRRKALLEAVVGSSVSQPFCQLFARFCREGNRAVPEPETRPAADLDSIEEHLPPMERRILQHLRRNPGVECPWDDLYTGSGEDPAGRAALAAAISRIRDRIRESTGSTQEYVKTVRGKGYVYVGPQQ